MADFVIAVILDDFKIGDRFTMWPLHITILPPFSAPSLETVAQTIKPIVKYTEPIHIQIGEFAKFGRDRTAQKIFPSSELQRLHEKILAAGEQAGWKIAGRYTGSYFTPHITTKAGRSYDKADFDITEIVIVGLLPQNYRELLEILPFAKAKLMLQ
jgi:2'-5' RNA ligase